VTAHPLRQLTLQGLANRLIKDAKYCGPPVRDARDSCDTLTAIARRFAVRRHAVETEGPPAATSPPLRRSLAARRSAPCYQLLMTDRYSLRPSSAIASL
jgi:hypothetical protein